MEYFMTLTEKGTQVRNAEKENILIKKYEKAKRTADEDKIH